MGSPPQRLSSLQLAELSLAAIRNSRRLFDDAQTLLAAGRHAGAFGSLCLAAEELGKHMLVAPMFGISEPTDQDWKEFWQRLRAHMFKAGNMLYGEWASNMQAAEAPRPRLQHDRRLELTYVDVSPASVIREPSELVQVEEVRALLLLVERELEFVERSLDGKDAAELAAALDRMRDSPRAAELRAHLEEGGPEFAIAFVLAVRNGATYSEALTASHWVLDTFRSAD